MRLAPIFINIHGVMDFNAPLNWWIQCLDNLPQLYHHYQEQLCVGFIFSELQQKLWSQIPYFLAKSWFREFLPLECSFLGSQYVFWGSFLNTFRFFSVQDTMHTLNGFTTFAYSTLVSVQENTMTSFDTDSSFWVCDNSAIRHICNNNILFIGDLVSSIYIVVAATGTLEPTLMATVQLQITVDNGTKHTFTLTHMNYMPTSPVNLLLTRVLSKQFTDENGLIRIELAFIHVMRIKHWYGIMANTAKLSRLILLAFLNVFLAQDILSLRHILQCLHHFMMMQSIGLSLQKQKKRILLIQKKAIQ